MHVKKPTTSEDPQRDDMKKKMSCFSNIKIFLVAECALMLAQGTVGAYLVSFPFAFTLEAVCALVILLLIHSLPVLYYNFVNGRKRDTDVTKRS